MGACGERGRAARKLKNRRYGLRVLPGPANARNTQQLRIGDPLRQSFAVAAQIASCNSNAGLGLANAHSIVFAEVPVTAVGMARLARQTAEVPRAHLVMWPGCLLNAAERACALPVLEG